ncbi:MAG: hypothetical protein ACU0BN_19570 [Sulfitobacter sp.]
MRTVSFQGGQLSRSQRDRLDQFRRVQASINTTILQQQVSETLAALEQRKSQGVKPERQWFVIVDERGTPCVADAFGF